MFNFGETGKLCLGSRQNETHYGIANTICAHMLMDGAPQKDRNAAIGKIIGLDEDALDILSLIMRTYLRSIGLER